LRIPASLGLEVVGLDLELRKNPWISLAMRLQMVIPARINKSSMKVTTMMISLKIQASLDLEAILLDLEFRRDRWINQVMKLLMVISQRTNSSSMKVIIMMISLRILVSLDLEVVELDPELRKNLWTNLAMRLLMVILARINKSSMKVITMMI